MKSNSEDAEIQAAVNTTGLDSASGPGMVIFNRLRGANGPRAKLAILDEDSMSNQSRNRVKNALGVRPTVVITEDLVTSLTDSEGLALQAQIVQYAPGVRVVHYLTELANPNPPFNLNSKTAEEWKVMFPSSMIIAVGGKEKVL